MRLAWQLLIQNRSISSIGLAVGKKIASAVAGTIIW